MNKQPIAVIQTLAERRRLAEHASHKWLKGLAAPIGKLRVTGIRQVNVKDSTHWACVHLAPDWPQLQEQR